MSNNKTVHENNQTNHTFKESFQIFLAKITPWVALILGCGLLIGIFVLLISQKKHTLEETRKKEEGQIKEIISNVKTWKIKPTKLINNIKLPGIVQPWESLILESEVTGKVICINKEEGQAVKKNDIIAQIEDSDYKSLKTRTKAELLLASQNYQRTKNLKKQGAVPQSKLDSAKASLDSALSAFNTATHNLKRCCILAPFDGIINKRFISLGSFAKPGSKIIELIDIHKVKVDIGIPEADITKVKNLKNASITIKALDNLKVTGKKIFLSVKPIEQAMVYNLRLSIDNKKQLLLPGMIVEANIIREIIPEAIVVPLYSVIAKKQETFCYVVKDDIAICKKVKLGIIKGNFVHIKSGLNVDDVLIVIGQRQLEDKQKIKVIEKLSSVKGDFN